MKSRTFKTYNKARAFADKLIKSGQLDVQIWELPGSNGKTEFCVLWREK